ncbi:hypothetical protein [Natrialba asiatica]|uniref:hypothetical protein n=1 Tax=Natrialba asiatica TaxID=64602 RepID=UPI000A078887|nr:hypothetical protein [Natrialba asiatica]
MVSRRKPVLVSLGFLIVVLLAGMGAFIVSHTGPDGEGNGDVDVESYPIGPEKPSPLNSSNVGSYAVTYEERLFYNDLLASRNHSFDADESVITDCTTTSVSNNSTDEYRVRLECRGGITDSSQLSESEEHTYSAAYRITNETTQQTELQNYPFDTDRRFNTE